MKIGYPILRQSYDNNGQDSTFSRQIVEKIPMKFIFIFSNFAVAVLQLLLSYLKGIVCSCMRNFQNNLKNLIFIAFLTVDNSFSFLYSFILLFIIWPHIS